MKLYTEKEIVSFLKKEFADEINAETFMENLTPIELPSDEEIEREARLYCNIKESLVIDAEERYYKDFQKYDGFKACAQWMRNKIQGGNNEQQ